MTASPGAQHYQCPTCRRIYRTADAAAHGWICCGARLQAVVADSLVVPSSPPVRLEFYEVQPGRASEAGGLAAENLFVSLVSGEHYSLEIWSEHRGHHLLVRAPSTVMPLVLEPIRAIYPQAATRHSPPALRRARRPGLPALTHPARRRVRHRRPVGRHATRGQPGGAPARRAAAVPGHPLAGAAGLGAPVGAPGPGRPPASSPPRIASADHPLKRRRRRAFRFGR